MMERQKVLYIAGSGRSGSTILDRVLGQATGFLGAGEVRAVWQLGLIRNEPCSCGTPFRDCSLWKVAVSEAIRTSSLDDVDPVVLRPRMGHAREMAVGLMPWSDRKNGSAGDAPLERLYSALARGSGARVVVDSSKSPRYALLLSGMSGIDLRVVHLVRDSRAVAHSHQRERLRIPTPGQPVYMGTGHPITFARRWIEKNLLSETLRWHGVAYLLLRYEDFATNPKTTIGRLEAFLDEDIAVPFADDHSLNLAPGHVPAGNYMRFQHGHTAIRLDDEWKHRMTPTDKLEVTAITWPLLVRYGYQI